jgi:GNAT superfamily N-acetyltransferase
MIRPLSRGDLPRVRELFARANDTPYDLAAVADEKCFGAGVAGRPEARVFGDFEGIGVTCGRYLRILAVDPAARGRRVGTALLREAESRGARVAGAEAGNYFTPGVPEALAPFFEKRGYRETARTQNLIVDELPSPPGRGWPPSAARRPGEGVQHATAETRDRVLAFIEREFGRIWRFEAEKAVDNLFYVEHEGEVAGFSAHDANNRGLGFFGPTGVAKSLRGRGLGRALLLASLADLRRLGYRRAIIPWTDAVEFYAKACGARVEARFLSMLRP